MYIEFKITLCLCVYDVMVKALWFCNESGDDGRRDGNNINGAGKVGDT